MMMWAGVMAMSLMVSAGGGPGMDGGAAVMVIDTFSGCVGRRGLPCGWHPSRREVAMFSLVHEAEQYYLRIDTRGGCTSAAREVHFSLADYPLLCWRWRVHRLPDGAREDRRSRADSGAGVYVIFDGALFGNRILKYVWSTTLAPDTAIRNPFNGRARVIVRRSGTAKLGRWIHEEVDMARDYRRVFGRAPSSDVVAIAVLSDADNTDSRATAEYDDFRVRSRP
jgi:hypothetical protein